jgi:hypothetical protein
MSTQSFLSFATMVCTVAFALSAAPAQASSSSSVMALCKNLPTAATCQNADPKVHGCSADSKRLALKVIYRGRTQIGHVELLGSAACRTKWAKVVPYRAAGRRLEITATILIGQDASAGVDVSGRGTVTSRMVFAEDGVYSASGLISRNGGIAYGATTADR